MNGSVVEARPLAGQGTRTLQDAYDADTAVPQILLNNVPDPLEVRASVAGEIFAAVDTGGIKVLEVDSDPDLIVARAGITIDESFTNSASPIALTFSDNFSTGGPYIGGSISSTGTIEYDNAFFIWALLAEGKTYQAAAAPGFAAFTLFNALPVIENSGNFDLVQALVLNAGVAHRRITAGTSVAIQSISVSSGPSTRATVAGATMTKSNGDTGLFHRATYSTVAGSTVNLGTQRGTQFSNPIVALFQPAAGIENATALIGHEIDALPFGGNIVKRGIRSALAGATNSRFIEHTGTAESDHNGNFNLDADFPNGILRQGASPTSDYQQGWIGGTEQFFQSIGSPAISQIRHSSPSVDRWVISHALNQGEINIRCDRFSLGQSAGPNGNQVGNFVTPARTIGVAGEWADFLLTQGGNLTVDGNNMSRVAAWVINPVSYANSTGTVTEADTLTVGGFPTSSPGVTITERQSLHVIAGRSRLDSAVQFESREPGVLANGNNNDWAGLLTDSPNNNMRYWNRVTGDNGGSNITGIDSTSAQDGDSFDITNIGTGPINFTNQDVNSSASNRIITPNGITVTITSNETCTVRWDANTDRWRVVASTGNF